MRRSRFSRTNLKVVIYEQVLKKLEREIASHPPEKGGYMFGELKDKGTVELCFFVLDEKASTTGASFVPSEEASFMLTRMNVVAKALYGEKIKFISVVHSHPGSFDHPSEGDVDSAMLLFEKNRGLSFVITPIITSSKAYYLEEHELQLGQQHKISFYCFNRGDRTIFQLTADQKNGEHPICGTGYTLETTWNVELAYLELQKKLGLDLPLLSWIELQGKHLLRATWELNEKIEIIGLFSRDFPITAPIIWVYEDNRPVSDLAKAEWRTDLPHLERIVEYFSSFIVVDNEKSEGRLFGVLYGKDKENLYTNEKDVAKRNKWKGFLVSRKSEKRKKEKTIEPVSENKVVIIGNGSVVSEVADCIARGGVESLILLNENETTPDFSDGIARRVLLINPNLRVEKINGRFEENMKSWTEQFSQATLLVSFTDETDAQERWSNVAYLMGITTVIIALPDKGKGGAFLVCNPSLRMPCYSCILGQSKNELHRSSNDSFVGNRTDIPAVRHDVSAIMNLASQTILALLSEHSVNKELNPFPELFSFGKQIVAAKHDHIVETLPVDSSQELSKLESDDTPPKENCGYSLSFFCSSELPDVIRRRESCHICGTDTISLQDYLKILSTKMQI